MTSKERKEGRYRRRKAAREKKIAARNWALGGFEDVFSFRHLYLAGKACCKNVGWKSSTQRSAGELLLETEKQRRELWEGVYVGRGFYCFYIVERGKVRYIRAVHISERQVQKCLCNYYLVPLYGPSMIYDNGASTKGKGMDFALHRLVKHLRRHYRKYGRTGGVLLGDLHDYFGGAPHGPMFTAAARYMPDERLRAIHHQFVAAFGDVGLGLGSQVSQVEALMLPNTIDHAMAGAVEWYERYMDDSLSVGSMDELQAAKGAFTRLCEEKGLVPNETKTRIVPLRSQFTFLKCRVRLTETGKVIVKMSRRSTVTMRRKLRTFKAKGLPVEAVRSSVESYHGQMARGNSYKTVQRTDHYFKELYGFYPNKRGWKAAIPLPEELPWAMLERKCGLV